MARISTVTTALFPPGRRFYEFYLQRLRFVLANRISAIKVLTIQEARESLGEWPSVQVVLSIAGLKLKNPVTDQPLISTDWMRQHFEDWLSQKAFWQSFAEHIGTTIPDGHPEELLRKKFKQVASCSPGNLPARADLWVEYQELVRDLKVARKFLATQPRQCEGFREVDKQQFLKTASHPHFWWARYVTSDEVSLEQIAKGSPESTAKSILALKHKVKDETVRDRLFRRE